MNSLYLHFDTDTREGNLLAEDLQLFLQENYQLHLPVVKENDNTQDAGSIIQIILGSAAIIELARGISLWMQKKPEAAITVTTDKEKTHIVATGVNSKDISEVLKTAEKLKE